MGLDKSVKSMYNNSVGVQGLLGLSILSLNDKMGLLTTVEDARQSLENIFKNNIDKPNNP